LQVKKFKQAEFPAKHQMSSEHLPVRLGNALF